jgi:hypothetical protein
MNGLDPVGDINTMIKSALFVPDSPVSVSSKFGLNSKILFQWKYSTIAESIDVSPISNSLNLVSTSFTHRISRLALTRPGRLAFCPETGLYSHRWRVF